MPQDNAVQIAANKLFLTPPEFMLSVARLEQLPPDDLNEVAFAGRSNVGKSSLINALFGRKDVAKTSATPGRTQQLNYFCVQKKLYMVDLPGYGYAKAPTAEVKRWQDVLKTYLRGRANLRRVFLLIDSRTGLKKADEDILKLLDESAVPYQIVLTKTDKVSKAAAENLIKDIALKLKNHAAAHTEILATSAEKKLGLDEVRSEISAFM